MNKIETAVLHKCTESPPPNTHTPRPCVCLYYNRKGLAFKKEYPLLVISPHGLKIGICPRKAPWFKYRLSARPRIPARRRTLSSLQLGLSLSSLQVGLSLSSFRLGLVHSSLQLVLRLSSLQPGLAHSGLQLGIVLSSLQLGLIFCSLHLGLVLCSL